MSLNKFDEEFLELFGDDEEVYSHMEKKISSSFSKKRKENECTHVYKQDNGRKICKLCGLEVDELNFEAEWRFYGASDNRTSRDPSRCHFSKQPSKGCIDSVFAELKLDHIQESTKKEVESRYKKIVGENTVRGKGRKGIVAACLLHVLKKNGDIKASDQIRKLFDLSKQEMSTGLSKYYERFKEDRTSTLKPKDLIESIMRLTGIENGHYDKIYTIAESLENTDEVLNHSNPKSVASAMVFFYICVNKKYKKSIGMTNDKFAEKTQLSSITIVKLTNKIAEICGYDNFTM